MIPPALSKDVFWLVVSKERRQAKSDALTSSVVML